MLVNGQHQNLLPVADRAVQYGDGAFETILVRKHLPVFWQAHLDRLSAACQVLQIPLDPALLRREADALIASHEPDGILKIIISRGAGGRGYVPPESPIATRIMQFHALSQEYGRNAQQGISVYKCRHPLSSNPTLAGLKHLNRLDQVLASLELPSQFQEGLMCNEFGDLIEGIKSNVFVVIDGALITPELSHCGVAGVMRGAIIKRAEAGVVTRRLSVEDLHTASEVFVCNSVMGLWPVTKIVWDQREFSFEIGTVSRSLQASFAKEMQG